MIVGGLLKVLLGAMKRIFVLKASFFREIILIYSLIYAILLSIDKKHIIIGRNSMPVCYDKLWKVLIDKRMNRTDLKDKAEISFNVLAKLGRDEFVSMESLYKICKALNCDIGDIVEFKKEMKNR